MQQGYALFLEACNSHAFDQALAHTHTNTHTCLQEFPLVQQGYALFLEACNSHAFNQALARCMSSKLQVGRRTYWVHVPDSAEPQCLNSYCGAA